MSLRVLFVDDETRLLTAYRRMFSSAFEVTTAETTEQAVALLAPGRFDIVVCDLLLGSGTAEEVLAEVQRVDPKVVRVVSSGNDGGMPELIERGVAHAFLEKPVARDKLEACVELLRREASV